MTEEDWDSGFGRAIAVFLNGQGIPGRDGRGQRVTDESFLMCFSAHHEAIDFHVPADEYAQAWEIVIDTHEDADDGEKRIVQATETISVGPRAIVVLRRAD